MKKTIIVVLISVASLMLLSSTATAAWCSAKYLHDPCAIDGFDIVQTEKFVRGKHNWMHDVHNLGNSNKVSKKKKRVIKKRVKRKKSKRYKYVKRCRVSKVRI
ncbi:MAG: hypothetical protein HF962_00295 [Sulfurovum sp.]|nr:hypothetical protein [Sulfurovum sp.]